MAETDHFLQTTQKFLDPASIQTLSDALGEPSEDVQAVLRTVIPTFMSDLITKGSTTEGAEEIVHLAEIQSPDKARIDEIFRSQYQDVAGVDSPLMEKLLAMVAPTILGSLLRTIRDEKMSPDTLRKFLQEQKKVLKGFITESPASGPPRYQKKKFPYVLLLAVLLLIIFGFFWFMSREKQTVTSITKNISEVHVASTTKKSLTSGLDELPAFFRDANTTEPKRFSFQEVGFIIGKTDFSNSGSSELDFVAKTLKRNPKSIVRVEAYIENTGDPDENLLLSENRAMLIREELIGRGVEPSRIRAEGLGATIGRGQIELVVQRLK